MDGERKKGLRGLFNAESIIGAVIFAIGVFWCASDTLYLKNHDAEVSESVPTLKTVAHLDLSDRDDLELISKDFDNDVAYYRYIQPDRNVSIGDTVYTFDGVGATLTSVDAVGFTFETESLTAGASGTAILNEAGNQIGYVSRRLENGKYYAIWS